MSMAKAQTDDAMSQRRVGNFFHTAIAVANQVTPVAEKPRGFIALAIRPRRQKLWVILKLFKLEFSDPQKKRGDFSPFFIHQN